VAAEAACVLADFLDEPRLLRIELQRSSTQRGIHPVNFASRAA